MHFLFQKKCVNDSIEIDKSKGVIRFDDFHSKSLRKRHRMCLNNYLTHSGVCTNMTFFYSDVRSSS